MRDTKDAIKCDSFEFRVCLGSRFGETTLVQKVGGVDCILCILEDLVGGTIVNLPVNGLIAGYLLREEINLDTVGEGGGDVGCFVGGEASAVVCGWRGVLCRCGGGCRCEEK